MLVKRMRQFSACVFQVCLKLVNFEHLDVPLILKEFEHTRERHTVQRLRSRMRGNFQRKQVGGGVHTDAGDGALTSKGQLLCDQAPFENVAKKTLNGLARVLAYPDLRETTGSWRAWPERAQVVTDIL